MHPHFTARPAAGARDKNYFSVETISSKTCHGNRLKIRQTQRALSAVITLTDDRKGSEVQPLAGAKRRMTFLLRLSAARHTMDAGCR